MASLPGAGAGVPRGLLPVTVGLARVVEGEADRALAIVGLTASGFLALREIHRGALRSQRDLARRLRLEPSTTCELLARLARRRFVHRSGRRSGALQGTGPALTPTGLAALERAAAIVAQLEQRWGRRIAEARARGIPDRTGAWQLGPGYGLRRWMAEGLDALAPRAEGLDALAPCSGMPRPGGR